MSVFWKKMLENGGIGKYVTIKTFYFLKMFIFYSVTTILANENNNYHIASVLRDQMKFVYNDTFLFSLFMVTEKSSSDL